MDKVRSLLSRSQGTHLSCQGLLADDVGWVPERGHVACAGIVYGLYLTLSSWVLFHVATAMTFFPDKCHLADLNTTPPVLEAYCASVSTLEESLCDLCMQIVECTSMQQRIEADRGG